MANNSMTRRQKEAVGLLSIGTFLEYFDLMLYVHLSVLLNELFFPETGPMIARLLEATAFCMTFAMRPIGGYIIGQIGDNIGRKNTVLITTFIMAGSCLAMAFLPTYKEIGIFATVMLILCRMLQGFSSLGEIMGAGIYLSETLKSPHKYIANGIMDMMSRLGGFFALGVGVLVLQSSFNWRYAFLIGAAIAVVGFTARVRLRETPDFANYKFRINVQKQLNKSSVIYEKLDKNALAGLFFGVMLVPFGFYISYMYFADFMKSNLGMTSEEVITHNFKFSIADAFILGFFAYLYKFIHPIKVIKASFVVLIVTLLFTPYYLNNIHDLGGENAIFALQIGIGQAGAINLLVWFKHFPISRRFTTVATTFGVSSALGVAIVSYGLIPLTKLFEYYAIWAVYLPVLVVFIWALRYLTKLEINAGSYYNYPYEDHDKPDTMLEDHRYANEDHLGDEYEPFKGSSEYSIKLLSRLDRLCIEMDKKVNIKAVKHAITFAKRWHDGQVRKIEDIPYYSHPLAVAEMVAERYLKTDVIVAAILHDVVEDSTCTVEEIEDKFNHRIAQIVDRLTKVSVDDGKEVRISLEQTMKRLYDAKDYETMFIKNCDREHNLQTIKGLNTEKQIKMAKETNLHLVGIVAYVAEKLRIHEGVYLENRIFKLASKVLRRVT
jgi:MFS family permease